MSTRDRTGSSNASLPVSYRAARHCTPRTSMSQRRTVLDRPGAATARACADAAGLGCALPTHIVGNGEIAANIGVGEEWIERRTGILSRRHTRGELTLLELAAQAARAALSDAQVEGGLLD